MNDRYYIRFMSDEEYRRLVLGWRLENETRHAKHAKSESEGFCFMPISALRDMFRRSYRGTWLSVIFWAHSVLGGIVDDSVAVVFRDDGADLVESHGLYADPFGDYDSLVCMTEACTNSYDKYEMVPVYVVEDFGKRYYEYAQDYANMRFAGKSPHLIGNSRR